MFSIKPNGDNSVPVTGSSSDPVALPLSAGQLGVWFAQQLNPSSAAYNIGEYIEICGPIDPVLFEQALRQVVIESEALCVRFVEQADGPRQFVGDSPGLALALLRPLRGGRRTRRGRSLDEGRPGAARRPAAGADVRLRPVQGSRPSVSSGTRATTTSSWTVSAWRWWRGVSPTSTPSSASGRRRSGARSARSADVLNEEAGYRTSEQFARDRQYLARSPGRSSGAGQPGRSLDRQVRPLHPPHGVRAARRDGGARTDRAPGGRPPSAPPRRRHRGLPASHDRRGGHRVRAAGRSPQRRCAQHARHGVERSAAAARDQFPDDRSPTPSARRRRKSGAAWNTSAFRSRTCGGRSATSMTAVRCSVSI